MAEERESMERMQAAIAGTLKAHWRLFLTEGIILLILGFAAILIPPIATFAVEFVIVRIIPVGLVVV